MLVQMFEGLITLNVWQAFAVLLIVTHITHLGVTIYLHRAMSHRSLTLHPVVSHFFRFWLWATTTINTKEFVAIHRKHHAVTETPEDPHSPKHIGLAELLFNGFTHYGREADKQETLDRYGHGTPDDWLQRNVYNKHRNLGAAGLLIINVVLFGPIGLSFWALQMILLPVTGLGIINGIGHTFGYRNFECPNAATNITFLAILIGGEELHNNHHAYPNSAKLSQKWYEFDIGWFWIRLFEIFGLAKVLSTGPVVARDAAKLQIDEDTVWATLNDRYQIMARYSRNVIMPYVRREQREKDTSNPVWRKARKILSSEESLLDSESKEQITQLLHLSPDLKTIYEQKQRLLEVWQKRSLGANEMIQALKNWCAEAEASGIQALEEFANYVQAHTIPKVPAT